MTANLNLWIGVEANYSMEMPFFPGQPRCARYDQRFTGLTSDCILKMQGMLNMGGQHNITLNITLPDSRGATRRRLQPLRAGRCLLVEVAAGTVRGMWVLRRPGGRQLAGMATMDAIRAGSIRCGTYI
jgi:hypothetical protein